MARAEIPPSLQEIRSPRTTASHIAALKQLKHEIIGHEQKKELVVHHGVAGFLVRDLAMRTASYKPFTASSPFASSQALSGPPLAHAHDSMQEDDEVWLQCVQIVTCLAHGGLAFVQPLLAAGVLPQLLGFLSPASVPPRLIVESLRAINAIAEALSSDILSSPESSALAQLADQLYAKPTIDALAEILAQRQASTAADEQIKLVLKIICISLRDSRGSHQSALVKAGVLDFICCRFASMVVVMRRNTQSLDPEFETSMLPAPPRSSLQYLLEALTCLCHNSAYRSMRILYSRHLLEVFPITSPNQHTSGEYLTFSDQPSSPTLNSNPLDYLLPKLQAVQSKNEHSFSRAFPALGAFVGSSEMSRMPYFNESHTMVSSRTISADEFGSPLIAWLIHMARNTHGLEKLAALEFLTRLISALDQKIMDSWSESSWNRDRTLAFLVVPLLVRIIDQTDPKNLARSKASFEEMALSNIVRERAPLALAVLIKECPALQKAAHDALAIKVLCQMLKKSFDPVTTMRTPMWTSTPQSMAMDAGEMDDPACSLGTPAMSAENIHRFRCRAASLRALAAIAQKEDQYRRNILDQTIISCLVDSLNPYPDGPISAAASDASGKEGNPWFVITAACRLAQALSRSVGVLRTSLIDAGIAKPIFKLLREHDARVREAGTDVVTNLVLHFSPMREELLGQGVVKVLCDHAHSADPKLRFSALWALKHLCASTPNDIKIGILEELGTGWLIQTMSGESSANVAGRAYLATPNAAGEQVDLLNAIDEPVMDIDDEDMESLSEDDDGVYSNEAMMHIPTVPARHRARLRAIKQEEESPVLRAKKDDVKITSQALDLVRNLISEVGPKQPIMIDHLLQAMGSTRFFECVASKLKPRPGKSATSGAAPAGKRPTLTTPSAAGTSSSTTEKERMAHLGRIESFHRENYMDDELVLSALFVLIHIGNGKPHHRHTLLNLTTQLASGTTIKLLDLTLPLFSHPEPKIRVACCWMVHNVMWMEDSGDAGPARQRALELRSRGFEEIVRGCLGDVDLDVRERARGCVDVWARVGGEGERGGGRAWER